MCLLYDCLFPWTIGGAERWYRNLAERLAAHGHEVTVVTMRHWSRAAPPAIPGVEVVGVAPGLPLYRHGRRRVLPPILFGLGVLVHLLRAGHRYDVVHTSSLSPFALLAAAAMRPAHRYLVVTDWHEFWTRHYWLSYGGAMLGRVGWSVQQLCLRVPQHAFTFSKLHEDRLRPRLATPPTLLRGLYLASQDVSGAVSSAPAQTSAPPVAVFAGRLIPEKAVHTLVPAVLRAREQVPGLCLDLYGDGPSRPEIGATIRGQNAEGIVRLHGIVSCQELEHALSGAACAVISSEREGYCVFLVEAMSHGCPVVVVAHPDNAATELVVDGVNGFVVPTADPETLGRMIARVVCAGEPLRRSTRAWYEAHASELSLDTSLTTVMAAYRAAPCLAAGRYGRQR